MKQYWSKLATNLIIMQIKLYYHRNDKSQLLVDLALRIFHFIFCNLLIKSIRITDLKLIHAIRKVMDKFGETKRYPFFSCNYRAYCVETRIYRNKTIFWI